MDHAGLAGPHEHLGRGLRVGEESQEPDKLRAWQITALLLGVFILSDKMKRDCQTKGLKRNLSGLHSGREPPVSQRPITDSKDIARVTGKDFIRRPKRFLHKRKSQPIIIFKFALGMKAVTTGHRLAFPMIKALICFSNRKNISTSENRN